MITRARSTPSTKGSSKDLYDDEDEDDNGSVIDTDDDSEFEDLLSEDSERPQDYSRSPSDVYCSSALEDLVLRLLFFLMTEEFEDGQSKSALLVYFTGVLGLTPDGSGFRRPGNFTKKLSAFIYCARLVVVEVLLPRTGHDYVGYPARPRHGQLDKLSLVRREKMCLASQAPVGELLSLRAYGRALSQSDGASFRFNWVNNAQTLCWDDVSGNHARLAPTHYLRG
ncbi:hypothetical protein CCHL11_10360 [Colletotrichum chlorophyti]|uniref:Uncharacterized protein n=1 Tax=Colletotrichum chlorophyti TaxID=708187 RepID=A0A1Q8RA30_9PEZI|nr:hypothetical protein CCHL11_10360 [Colletotrichum chlorophyti]